MKISYKWFNFVNVQYLKCRMEITWDRHHRIDLRLCVHWEKGITNSKFGIKVSADYASNITDYELVNSRNWIRLNLSCFPRLFLVHYEITTTSPTNNTFCMLVAMIRNRSITLDEYLVDDCSSFENNKEKRIISHS